MSFFLTTFCNLKISMSAPLETIHVTRTQSARILTEAMFVSAMLVTMETEGVAKVSKHGFLHSNFFFLAQYVIVRFLFYTFCILQTLTNVHRKHMIVT